jgi:hypothetical protein
MNCRSISKIMMAKVRRLAFPSADIDESGLAEPPVRRGPTHPGDARQTAAVNAAGGVRGQAPTEIGSFRGISSQRRTDRNSNPTVLFRQTSL